MIKIQQKHVFFLGIVLMLGVLVGLTMNQERIIRGGTEVVLETRPVDPRDLFRGEHVILRYAIEEDPMVKQFALGLRPGSTIYILLERGPRGVARVYGVGDTPPDPNAAEAWIAGEVGRFGEVRFPSIEQFYVPEGAGGPIEDMRNDLHVKVSLQDGEARIIELLDGSLTPVDPFEYTND